MALFLPKEERARLKEIAHVLYKHDMGFILAKLGLRKFLPFTKHIKTHRFRDKALTPKKLLKIFEEIDGSFLKLGQLLSIRSDLIPIEYAQALSELQDHVKPFPGSEAKKIIEKEFNKPINKIFKDFQTEPIASASIGQVHKATLLDNTKVVVKVQRPDIKKTIQTDIKLLHRLARLLKARYNPKNIDPVAIVKEFERYTNDELDYFKEARNISHFQDLKTIKVPKVYWDHCAQQVLTMEYIHGTSLKTARLKPAEMKCAIRTILDSEYEQIFFNGYFHADPHPGNYFILNKKGKNRIALLDYGIVGKLDEDLRHTLGDLFIAMIAPDLDGIVDAAMRIGVIPEDTDTKDIKRDLYDGLSKFYGVSLENLKASDALIQILNIFRKHRLKISADFVLLSKATLTLESVALKYDPNFNFVKESKPFVQRLARQKLNPKVIAKRVSQKTREFATFIDQVPKKTNIFLNELSRTDQDLRKIDKDIGFMIHSLDTSSNRVTLGFLAGSSFIAATLLMPYTTITFMGFPALSFFAFLVSFLLMFALILSILREKHK
ncbi:ABC1 kinase family protein [Nanoarchaeota archaeon]